MREVQVAGVGDVDSAPGAAAVRGQADGRYGRAAPGCCCRELGAVAAGRGPFPPGG